MVRQQVLPHTMEGIYSHKQPGCRSHPALKSMKSASSTGSLRHSASLVLGDTSTTCGTSQSMRSDIGYVPAYPIARQKLSAPFLKEMPSRLEGCRHRLAAADHAMSQVVTWEPRREDKPDDSNKDMPREMPGSSGSIGYGLSELAPESPMMGETILVEDDLYTQADAESRETKLQLGKIEQQLCGLDKRWQSVEKERRDWELLRCDLLEKLRASESKYHNLHNVNEAMHAKHATLCDVASGLRADLAQSEATAEKLRQDLGVSEEKANASQAEVSRFQSREVVLNTQIATLHTRLYQAESEAVTLRNHLESSELEKGDITHTLNNLQETHDALIAAEAILRDEHTQHVQITSTALAEKDREIQQHKENHDALQAEKERDALLFSQNMDALKSEKEIEIQEHVNNLNLALAEKDAEIRRHADTLHILKAEKDLEIQQQIERNSTLQTILEKGGDEHKEDLYWKAIAEERAEALETATQRIQELEQAVQLSQARQSTSEGVDLDAQYATENAVRVGDTSNAKLELTPMFPHPSEAQSGDDLFLPEAQVGDVVEVELPPVGAHFLDSWDQNLIPSIPSETETVFSPRCDMLLRATTAQPASRGTRPTQCQVVSGKRELRLLPLGPIGPPRIIPFDSILSVEQLTETDIRLHWVPVGSKPDVAHMNLQLSASDESASSMLVAALTVFDRGRPGSSVATPDTPRSRNSDA